MAIVLYAPSLALNAGNITPLDLFNPCPAELLNVTYPAHYIVFDPRGQN